MSVGNIIDRRNNKYAVEVDAVFEPSWHDNTTEDATQFFVNKNAFDIENTDNTTVEEAIEYCNTFDFQITVYLYDKDSDPCGSIDETDDELNIGG